MNTNRKTLIAIIAATHLLVLLLGAAVGSALLDNPPETEVAVVPNGEAQGTANSDDGNSQVAQEDVVIPGEPIETLVDTATMGMFNGLVKSIEQNKLTISVAKDNEYSGDVVTSLNASSSIGRYICGDGVGLPVCKLEPIVVTDIQVGDDVVVTVMEKVSNTEIVAGSVMVRPE